MEKRNIQITYDDEARCPSCGAIGINCVEREDIVYGDTVTGHTYFLICECGGAIREIEDYEEGGEQWETG